MTAKKFVNKSIRTGFLKATAVFAAFMICTVCLMPGFADEAKLGRWNVNYWTFDPSSYAFSSSSASGYGVTAYDTGEIRLSSEGSGAFRTLALSSRKANELGSFSVSFKLPDGFSFNSYEGFNSWICFTWSNSVLFSQPVTFADLGNSGPAGLLPASAVSLSIILTGSEGRTATSVLIIARDGSGAEQFWSIPVSCDLSQPTELRIAEDSWFGRGYIITLAGVELSAEGTGFAELDLNFMAGRGLGFITMSSCGGYSGQPGASFLSVCGVGANSYTASSVETDSNGLIVTETTPVTTEPAPVTTTSGPTSVPSTQNPDSGDAGMITAVVCIAAAAVVAFIVLKKR